MKRYGFTSYATREVALLCCPDEGYHIEERKVVRRDGPFNDILGDAVTPDEIDRFHFPIHKALQTLGSVDHLDINDMANKIGDARGLLVVGLTNHRSRLRLIRQVLHEMTESREHYDVVMERLADVVRLLDQQLEGEPRNID